MRKLIWMLLVLMFFACGRKHVYNTYFGKFDVDTMLVSLNDNDGSACYVVHVSPIDSVEKAPGVWGYIPGPIIYYYNPSKDLYYVQFPTNDEHGNVITRFYPEEVN